jgi:hypothetical protein
MVAPCDNQHTDTTTILGGLCKVARQKGFMGSIPSLPNPLFVSGAVRTTDFIFSRQF